MASLIWIVVFLAVFGLLAYQGASMVVSTIAIGFLLICYTKFGAMGWFGLSICWLLFTGAAVLLNVARLRQQLITKKLFDTIRNFMPELSETESAALEAGTVGWEGELFSGRPDWQYFKKIPNAKLNREEREFIDGPVNKLCQMIDNWEITHELLDLPEKMWTFLKREGFFGLIIPKEYGGKEFSATAHSTILVKVAGRSNSVATVIAVPNSLGPAELLLEYGTPAQKEQYLPALAAGDEIPCFALTGPEAGSDASNLPDTGVICKDKFEGETIIGIRLNWNKRYITLAPVATVLGLAFRLLDPDHIMGNKDEIGITCALIPVDTQGVTTGRRHYPLNSAFPNGPTQGKDVFIPLDWIIGGFERAGQGWKMLVERLGVGRAISLPSLATGGSLTACAGSGAYARIREQFGLPIGKFGGIQEALARIGGYSYLMNAVRLFTVSAIDNDEEPAVPSAMCKYHLTEMGRIVINNAMDMHGGKGICMGPRNYLGRLYQETPIGITVEGANILTRSMIIFGQGAVRCHPYVLAEINACKDENVSKALVGFDRAIWGHVGHLISNTVRSFWLGVTRAKLSPSPYKTYKNYYQAVNRLSAQFAFIVDVTMVLLGNRMKRLEKISGRLGDVHSALYFMSAVLKQFNVTNRHKTDRFFVDWSCQMLLYQAENALDGLLRNYPNKWIGRLCRVIIFPFGRTQTPPSDQLLEHIARVLMTPSVARDRLLQDVYLAADRTNPVGQMQEVLQQMIKTSEIRGKLHHAARKGKISGVTLTEQIASAKDVGMINEKQFEELMELDEARREMIAVDDFE